MNKLKNILKNLIIRILGKKNFNYIYIFLHRLLTFKHKKIVFDKNIIKYNEYLIENRENFFGYYDINPFNNEMNNLLTIAINNKENADIGYFDVNSKKYNYITQTHCWNWQMGCRLRWKDNNTILFNDFDGKNFVSKVFNKNGVELKKYKQAFFDIDKNYNFGYYVDFCILNVLRPGYGYINKKIDILNYYNIEHQGLFKYDLENDKDYLILSLRQINKEYPTEFDNDYIQYINHVSVNKFNDNIMFFQIWTKLENINIRKSRIVICNTVGKIINIFENFDQVSHYCWKNENELLLTVLINNTIEYRLYNLKSNLYTILFENILIFDGHPNFIDSDIFITDTYPDKFSMQKIYICNSKTNMCKEIFSIYHSPDKTEEYRCDLHPYIYKNKICIDSNFMKKRRQIVIEIKKRDKN